MGMAFRKYISQAQSVSISLIMYIHEIQLDLISTLNILRLQRQRLTRPAIENTSDLYLPEMNSPHPLQKTEVYSLLLLLLVTDHRTHKYIYAQ